jgi:2-oxoisovalerate dehydrogenase E1 component
MESHIVDGNNILEVYNLVSGFKKSMMDNHVPFYEFKL